MGERKRGLSFNSKKLRSIVRENCFGRRISFNSCIFFSGVLEYLTAEVLELSIGRNARGKSRISPRSIFVAIRGDLELNEFVQFRILKVGENEGGEGRESISRERVC